MAIDLPPLPEIAAIFAPQDIDKKRRKGQGAAIAIGTIILLSTGARCLVVGVDARGRPLCHPDG